MAKILHISSIPPEPSNGMGRVSYYWKLALEEAGHEFTHIGPEVLKNKKHPLILGWYLRRYLKKNKVKADLILAHEPLAGFLYFKNTPLISFSHGIEERVWLNPLTKDIRNKSLKTKLLPSKIRFISNNFGFKKAYKIFILNTADSSFLISKKNISRDKINILKNGYYDYKITHDNIEKGVLNFLFNSSWIERKGIKQLQEAFNYILRKYNNTSLLIAGVSKEKILRNFCNDIHSKIKIIEKFTLENEYKLYENCNVFIMPSYSEGQSLALTQAMAMRLCPIVSDNSGQIDFVTHQENGLIFKTGDTQDFIKQIEFAINNPEMIIEYGKKANTFVKGMKWKNVTMDFVKIINSVLALEQKLN